MLRIPTLLLLGLTLPALETHAGPLTCTQILSEANIRESLHIPNPPAFSAVQLGNHQAVLSANTLTVSYLGDPQVSIKAAPSNNSRIAAIYTTRQQQEILVLVCSIESTTLYLYSIVERTIRPVQEIALGTDGPVTLFRSKVRIGSNLDGTLSVIVFLRTMGSKIIANLITKTPTSGWTLSANSVDQWEAGSQIVDFHRLTFRQPTLAGEQGTRTLISVAAENRLLILEWEKGTISEVFTAFDRTNLANLCAIRTRLTRSRGEQGDMQFGLTLILATSTAIQVYFLPLEENFEEAADLLRFIFGYEMTAPIQTLVRCQSNVPPFARDSDFPVIAIQAGNDSLLGFRFGLLTGPFVINTISQNTSAVEIK